MMFKNYLTIALRNIVRHKGYSLLNILGLATGIACAIFILLYVQHELSYDRYHPGAERIYRVNMHKHTEARDTYRAGCSTLLVPILRGSFPEVEAAARFATKRPYAVSYGEKVFFQDGLCMADEEILSILAIPFLQGNPQTALMRPFTVILTESTAQKYFGDVNPIGKTIKIGSFDRTDEFEVTGVVADQPSNSHLEFSLIQSYATQEVEPPAFPPAWDGGIFPTFVKLAPGADPVAFEQRIAHIAHEQIGEELEQKKVTITHSIQPISSIHLAPGLTWEKARQTNPLYLYIFTGVGILILAIAAMNFMNLATARSANRSCEVGVRKVIGARRHQLIRQFLGESLMTTGLSLIVALAIVDSTMPMFNSFSGVEISLKGLLQPGALAGMIALVLLVGLAAGAYPALFLSAFQPVEVLKGKLRSGSRGACIRKFLVIGQFAISIILIIGVVVLYQQLLYMKNHPLGFDKEQKLVIGLDIQSVNCDNSESVKAEFLANTNVTGAAFSSSVPGRWMYYWRTWPAGGEVNMNLTMNFFQVDHDFIPLYDIQMKAGRAFKKDLSSDYNGYVINQAAAKAFGWGTAENAVGQFIRRETTPVLGVMEDFHFRGLQGEVDPLVIFLMEEDFKYLTLQVETDQLDPVMAFVEDTYRRLFPGQAYEFFFLDNDFDRQYRAEEQLARVFTLFTGLGILIACLGLFGVVAFIAEQRTKEIGVRKVLGATVTNIVALLIREFVVLVVLAGLIATPVAWYAVQKWLQNFAYRIDLEWWIFLGAGGIALALALVTISFQAIKAATADPVKSLRYE